ncbi:MAG: permease [Acidobacteria bacterium]|nr:MAG: permease [Acidobacteriota bacterium]PYY02816.1 MAG: permease [Acidobacteriota bacterium]PYY24692.1 MAG: permease [Acidobacteriota bacterium]
MTIAISLVLGFLTGILSGMVGIGGGIIIIPALVYGFHMNQRRAQGTSIGVLLAPIGILAFVEYYKAGNVDVKIALLIALGFFFGAYFGGSWAQQIPQNVLRKMFAVLLAVTAAKMFFQK